MAGDDHGRWGPTANGPVAPAVLTSHVMTSHVVLVGMMGSGKTSVGRRLAKLLDRPFVDADEGFIARYGRTVARTFDEDGEAGFRTLEAKLLAELLDVADPLVIATGGGVVVREENRRRLAEPDVCVVLLHAGPAFLATRAKAKSHRPLLAGDDPAVVLDRLYDERIGWYREVADHIVDIAPFHADDGPKPAMAEHVAALVEAR
jgi:shikimate kinase